MEEDWMSSEEKPKWFEKDSKNIPDSYPTVSDEELIKLKDDAKKFHDSESVSYSAKKSRTQKDYQWIKTVLSKGTASDKLAANTVLIQDNPVFNLTTIRNMVNSVKSGKKHECSMIMDTLADLFLSDLLIPDRKLKRLAEQPLSVLDTITSGNVQSRRNYLVRWHFENELKEIYHQFVQALNSVAHDSVEATKEKAIANIFKLLNGNGEQEQNLLALLVNKLGDPSSKVASKTIYCLGQLLYHHPNMKVVVLAEIEKLLFRPNVTPKAQYYAICFLSQFHLDRGEDTDVANKLVNVYLAFFNACVKKGDVSSRLMAALLMGINRAFPYSNLADVRETIDKHVNTMFRVVHLANFNVSVHALNILFQISASDAKLMNRFYTVLYRKMVEPEILTSTHQAMLLNLLYKSLKCDGNVERVKVFVKRMLQIALNSSVPMACGLLFLISNITRLKKNTQRNGKLRDKNVADVQIKEETDVIVKEETYKTSYDPLARNPAFAGGKYAVYTELALLQHHFHPTVALFSEKLANGENISYSGDPLKDFTNIRFLDRFVFKNPKKIDEINEKPIGYHFKFGQRKAYKPSGVRSLAVNSSAYLKESAKKIPSDELFLYEFLQRKRKFIGKEDKDDDDSDLDSVNSEEFEEMITKMGGVPEDEEDDEAENVDYLNELSEALKDRNDKKSKKRRKDDDEDESDGGDDEGDENGDSGGDDFNDGDDESNDADDNQSDLNSLAGSDDLKDFDDDDEEDIEFGSDNDSDGNEKVKSDLKSLFASADEFSMLLEKAGSSKIKPGTSQAVYNKDKSAEKQLDWEEKRHRWVSGFNKALGNKRKSKNNRNSSVKPNKRRK